ncbi:hypothetical protein chiPu_0030964, partial [Chiloscyllium punctatum]|nr:hypothetical protein [Chiloscyllium punctatum]
VRARCVPAECVGCGNNPRSVCPPPRQVSELRQQLRKRGLPVSGTKPALLERLRPLQALGARPAPAPVTRGEDRGGAMPAEGEGAVRRMTRWPRREEGLREELGPPPRQEGSPRPLGPARPPLTHGGTHPGPAQPPETGSTAGGAPPQVREGNSRQIALSLSL